MTPEVREKARKLRQKLCTEAEEYKGVRPESCKNCESPCQPGKDLLKLLGLDAPKHAQIGDVFEVVHLGRDVKMRRIIRATNRKWK